MFFGILYLTLSDGQRLLLLRSAMWSMDLYILFSCFCYLEEVEVFTDYWDGWIICVCSLNSSIHVRIMKYKMQFTPRFWIQRFFFSKSVASDFDCTKTCLLFVCLVLFLGAVWWVGGNAVRFSILNGIIMITWQRELRVGWVTFQQELPRSIARQSVNSSNCHFTLIVTCSSEK